MPRFRWVGIAVLLLTACRAADALPPTATTLRVEQSTRAPTDARELRSIASQTPGATATEDNCQVSADLPTTQHTAHADIDYAQHRAVVQQHILTINRSNESLTQVVFDVEANRFPDIFTLSTVTTNLGVLNYELTGRRLTINLGSAFAPGCALEIDLDFTLNMPEIGQGITAYDGYFGYSSHQLNLGQWRRRRRCRPRRAGAAARSGRRHNRARRARPR